MREISTVLGSLEKPVDVELPKDLVRTLSFSSWDTCETSRPDSI